MDDYREIQKMTEALDKEYNVLYRRLFLALKDRGEYLISNGQYDEGRKLLDRAADIQHYLAKQHSNRRRRWLLGLALGVAVGCGILGYIIYGLI